MSANEADLARIGWFDERDWFKRYERNIADPLQNFRDWAGAEDALVKDFFGRHDPSNVAVMLASSSRKIRRSARRSMEPPETGFTRLCGAK